MQAEFLAWLRQILVNVLHGTFARHVKAGKRDIRREISIDQVGQGVDHSATRLAFLLPANGPSPSNNIQSAERTAEIANQLSRLNPDYREVIILRNLHGLSFEEVAQRMDRSSGAVRMLWLRAIDQFKETMNISHV
jgi:RNA polymerase sigma-70 factor (ECF subfamily)